MYEEIVGDNLDFRDTVFVPRPNVKVESNVLVTRVLFDGVRAVGVEFVDHNGDVQRRVADQEVILSGGAINSPQLLMLSGVGDASHLKSLGVPLGNGLLFFLI